MSAPSSTEHWTGGVVRSGGRRTLSDRIVALHEWGSHAARRVLAAAPTLDAVGR